MTLTQASQKLIHGQPCGNPRPKMHDVPDETLLYTACYPFTKPILWGRIVECRKQHKQRPDDAEHTFMQQIMQNLCIRRKMVRGSK